MTVGKKGVERDVAKERFWRKTLAQWRRSGQSVRAFCRRAGLSEPSFYAWRRELARRDVLARKPDRHSTFVPVQVLSPESGGPSLELVLTGGRVLRIPPGCDAVTLATVVAVLEQRPC